jgi:AraC family transcriptional regulator
MHQSQLTDLDDPHVVDGPALRIAGLSARYSLGSSTDMPGQWRKFVPHIGHIPGQVGWVTYGVLCNPAADRTIDYICGVEVSDFAQVPADFARLEIPEHRYAVFIHRGPVSSIKQTWYAIMSHGLRDAGCTEAGFPQFERYSEDFNPMTGEGTIEIWIPIQE